MHTAGLSEQRESPGRRGQPGARPAQRSGYCGRGIKIIGNSRSFKRVRSAASALARECEGNLRYAKTGAYTNYVQSDSNRLRDAQCPGAGMLPIDTDGFTAGVVDSVTVSTARRSPTYCRMKILHSVAISANSWEFNT